MNMHLIDWMIPIGIVILMLVICWVSSSLNRSVSDFLAANRMAGRYLLAIGSGVSGLGAISIAANFEKYYQAGFAAYWWAQMVAPIGLILALSGFVTYRYRETRAMTMAQFFEMRYSRRFRIFSGALAWTSGIFNYGIFPAVSANFIIKFTGLPTDFQFLGLTLQTLPVTMALLLGVAAAMAMLGGQIAGMVTDMIQGQFVTIAMLVILIVLFYHMSWAQVVEGLRHSPEGHSRINPFKQDKVEDFNAWFFMMAAFLQVYGTKAWQGSQGYNAAARTPHEARMAGILGEFRGMITGLVLMMVPIFVFAYLHLPQYADEAASLAPRLAAIGDAQLEKQLLVPMALGDILPIGVMGMFAAVIILASVGTDNTYLHSWGSIFIQDVLMPFRKKPLSTKAHMRLLRISMLSVAVFAFSWSLLFPLNEYIYMYFQITGAIYLGGAGAVILGGLYWSRGTASGAWAAMITGSSLAVLGIALRNIVWPMVLPSAKASYPDLELWSVLPAQFPLNGMQMSFGAAGAAIVAYVVGSLLSKAPPANMDKLLHRGAYANKADHPKGQPLPVAEQSAVPLVPVTKGKVKRTWWQRLGVGPEFTRGDKLIYALKLGWVMLFVTAFAVGTTVNFFYPIPDSVWEKWWAFKVGLTGVVGAITVVWFLWGGFHDLKVMIRELRASSRDSDDDGSVAAEDHVQPVPNEKP